jgi:small-conductance mechanosensitive channel
VRRIARLAERTQTDVDDLLVELLRRARTWFFLAVAVDAGVHALRLPAGVIAFIEGATMACVLLQAALWGNCLVAYLVRRMVRSESAASTTVLSFIGRLLLWSLLALLLLDNLGINVTALVAGLGIGGVALALAVQNILGDLFASLSIMIDKPFVIGDFVAVDALSGTVEHIGLKTTHLRSFSGEQLVFSNADLLRSRIRNFQRMEERRVTTLLALDLRTADAQLRAVPAMVADAVAAVPAARFERAHLKEVGPVSLQFEVLYTVLSPDYGVYLDVNERIALGLLERLRRAGIGFAYPAQRVLVERGEEGACA